MLTVFANTGVGYSWIDGLKDYAARSISDEQMSKAAERWALDTPETKEAYLIRQLFEGHFPSEAAAKTAVRWIPRAVSTSFSSRRSLLSVLVSLIHSSLCRIGVVPPIPLDALSLSTSRHTERSSKELF